MHRYQAGLPYPCSHEYVPCPHLCVASVAAPLPRHRHGRRRSPQRLHTSSGASTRPGQTSPASSPPQRGAPDGRRRESAPRQAGGTPPPAPTTSAMIRTTLRSSTATTVSPVSEEFRLRTVINRAPRVRACQRHTRSRWFLGSPPCTRALSAERRSVLLRTTAVPPSAHASHRTGPDACRPLFVRGVLKGWAPGRRICGRRLANPAADCDSKARHFPTQRAGGTTVHCRKIPLSVGRLSCCSGEVTVQAMNFRRRGLRGRKRGSSGTRE